jgi:tetratricopeptide (TPR) repeat protein
MDQNQENDNFIDKTFSIMTDIFVKTLPLTKVEKEGFIYYRYGMNAQSKGKYGEALEYYYQALNLEEDPYDRSYILYNIGLIFSNTGKYSKALEYYYQALEFNANLPQAVNNIAVIYHYHGLKASQDDNLEVANLLFDEIDRAVVDFLSIDFVLCLPSFFCGAHIYHRILSPVCRDFHNFADKRLCSIDNAIPARSA